MDRGLVVSLPERRVLKLEAACLREWTEMSAQRDLRSGAGHLHHYELRERNSRYA